MECQNTTFKTDQYPYVSRPAMILSIGHCRFGCDPSLFDFGVICKLSSLSYGQSIYKSCRLTAKLAYACACPSYQNCQNVTCLGNSYIWEGEGGWLALQKLNIMQECPYSINIIINKSFIINSISMTLTSGPPSGVRDCQS